MNSLNTNVEFANSNCQLGVQYMLVQTRKLLVRLFLTFLMLKQGCVLYTDTDYTWVFMVLQIFPSQDNILN